MTASRARLNQHYGRFVTVIFSAKHVEVKQAKEILSRKWQREDLCVFKSFYKFHVENVSVGIDRLDVLYCAGRV